MLQMSINPIFYKHLYYLHINQSKMVWFWLIRLRNFTDTQDYSAKAVEKEGVLVCISKGLFCFFNPFFFFWAFILYQSPMLVVFTCDIIECNHPQREDLSWHWRQRQERWTAWPWILAAWLIVMWPWPPFNDSKLQFPHLWNRLLWGLRGLVREGVWEQGLARRRPRAGWCCQEGQPGHRHHRGAGPDPLSEPGALTPEPEQRHVGSGRKCVIFLKTFTISLGK